MKSILYFIVGFLIGILFKIYRHAILFYLNKAYYFLLFTLYYRPKVRKYKRLIEKRGWKQKNSDPYAEWEHSKKGTKHFYSAVCLETGKEVRI